MDTTVDVVELECDSEEDGYPTIKLEPVGEECDVDQSGQSEQLHLLAPDMANLAGINGILCKVKGNVKCTSPDSGQTKWKTGSLELATMATGQVVCVVNFEIGPSKKFPLTNQIKGVIFNHTTPRCVINLKNGTNINWLGKGTDIGPVDFFSQILEELKNEQKRDRRPNTSALTSLHLSPQGKALSPVKQVAPQSTYSIASSHENQSSAIEMTGPSGTNQVMYGWDSIDEVEMEPSAVWMQNSSQGAAEEEEIEVQPEPVMHTSLKSKKPSRPWTMTKRNGKKWPRLYSQHVNKQHKCSICGETFIHKRSLDRHVMIVHGPKVYFWCKRCCRFYNRRDNLRTHYRSHHPKYINDVDHIRGVGRESLISAGGMPLPAKASGGPPVNSSSHSGTNVKLNKSRNSHATQLTEREQGAVGARQENLRIRSAFVHKEKDKAASRQGTIPQSSSTSKQTEKSPMPSKQLPVLSVPQVDPDKPVRKPPAKATPSALTPRGNLITTADVLAYQITRDSEEADEDIVEVSEDSSSEEEPEPPRLPPEGSRDEGVTRLERGTPFRDLQIEKVMQGQVTRVSEEHQTFIYSGGKKIRTERRKRAYNVLHLDEVAEGKRQKAQSSATTSSNSASSEQLDKRLQGRVTKVTETSSKYTYSAGEKVTKEKMSRVYDVMLLAGLTNI